MLEQYLPTYSNLTLLFIILCLSMTFSFSLYEGLLDNRQSCHCEMLLILVRTLHTSDALGATFEQIND